MHDVIFTWLSNEDLLQCRQVSRNFQDLASHVLDRRHQALWDWDPYFANTDDDDWVHGKMIRGVVAGGLPACCFRHNFEAIQFHGLLTKSLLIWIDDINMSEKLNKVVQPFLWKHGFQLTSFTLSLDECSPKSIYIGDLSKLLSYMPCLKNLGLQACNCSVRPKGLYPTRGQQFPALPHLEVLDLEHNENVILTDSLLESYGNQIKRLVVSSDLIEKSKYVQAIENKRVFQRIQDLKIGQITGSLAKIVGEDLWRKLCNMPTWRLKRLSFHVEEWILETNATWKLDVRQLLQIVSKFSESLTEFHLSFENEDVDLRDWFVFPVAAEKEFIFPNHCPNLRKVTIDCVLMKTPLLLKILKCVGNVEELQFLMWHRIKSALRLRVRNAGENIPSDAWPKAKELPRIIETFWKTVPTLQKISISGKNDNLLVKSYTRNGSTKR